MNSSQINNKLVTLLAAVCVALLLVLVGELIYAKQARQQLLSANLSADKNQSQDEMPGIDLAQHNEDSYADMVNRPLFIEGRKPVIEPTAEQTQANAVTVKFDWQLNGVYTTTKGLSALFTRATIKVPKDNYRKIRQGTDLDGWKLSEIQKDKVILIQEGSRKELMLRKPKQKQLPPKRTNPQQPTPNDPETASQPVESGQIPEDAPVVEPELLPETESPEDTLENSDNEQF